jgi:hypothetical protein
MFELPVLMKLIQVYLSLEDGALIEHPDELLKILEIDGSNMEHPHRNFQVCITRRALKHVVESRKNDLLRKHSRKQIEDMLLFAVAVVPEVFHSFESYKLEPTNKHFYTKDYSEKGLPSVRVLAEVKGNILLIRSIHFTKRTKKHRL